MPGGVYIMPIPLAAIAGIAASVGTAIWSWLKSGGVKVAKTVIPAAKKAAPSIAKYGALGAVAGSLTKPTVDYGAGRGASAISTDVLAPLSKPMRATMESRLTDRQHRRELQLQRELAYLQTVRDIAITAMRHPTLGYVTAFVAVDNLAKFGIIYDDTATKVKTILLTDFGVRSAAILVDALVPG
jgi:hypothetical protein